MRLWSLHPCYLDRQGLLAVWREGLLAQKVLLGETKGYKNHPQLERFRKAKYPIFAISEYLIWIWVESIVRHYNFDSKKIYFRAGLPYQNITVTKGQLIFELKHLYKKLEKRDKEKYNELHDLFFGNIEGFINIDKIRPHPLFKVIEGGIEKWERIKS
jgi:hypothetical protein